MGLDSLIGRMMVRETARATVSAAKRAIPGVSVHGATVRSASPSAGVVVVHVDGDPPGEATQIAAADWEFVDVGQRVLVLLFPPSGAAMIGPIGAPATWSTYPSDYLPWSSSFRKTPTLTTLYGDTDTIAGDATSTIPNEDLTASRVLVLLISATCYGFSDESTFTGASSVTNDGVPLQWTRAATRSEEVTVGGGTQLSNAEIWWAYSTTTQTSSVTITWNGVTTDSDATLTLLSAENAERVQAGATGTAHDTADSSVVEIALTTTYDHAHVLVAAAVGKDDSGGGPTWTSTTAGAGDTIITTGPVATDQYRRHVHMRTTAGVATPTATTVSFTHAGLGTVTAGVLAAMELVGTRDTPLIGDGTLHASYRLKGKSLELRLGVVAGSTTSFGSGNLAFRLPPGMTAASLPAGGRQSIGGSMLVGTNEYRVRAVALAGADSFSYVLYQDGSAQFLDATHPATLGSTFRMDLTGIIEIA